MHMWTFNWPQARRAVGGLGAAVALALGAACGGSGSSDTPTTVVTEPPATEMLVKNKPLNNCVNVVSGQRPPPGVTIPRCVPATTAAAQPPRK